MAISLHLKVTITFIRTNIWFKQSSENTRGLSTSSYSTERLESSKFVTMYNPRRLYGSSCNQGGQKVICIALNQQPVANHARSPGI